MEGEFTGNAYGGRPCRFCGVQIQTGGANLQDIRTPEEVEVVRQNIHSLLNELKEQGQRIHLGLSGGRRLISLVALAAAMQYLTPADRIWHTYTPPESLELTRTGNILHAPPEASVRLIAVPFVPWVAYFPGLSTLLKRSQQEMGEAAQGWLSEAERRRCACVWESLTARQKEILHAFAEGLSRKEVAQRLGVAVTTVDSHRDKIIEQCELVWDDQAGEEFNSKFIQKCFGPFLAGHK